MDEAAAAATIRTDGAEDDPLSGDGVSGNTSGPSSEDTPDRVGLFCCQDCGEAFREEATYLEHRQHHLQGKTLYLDNQSDSFQDAEKDGETTNFCSLCSLTFAELSDFHSHMKDNHGPTSQKACGAQMNSGKTKQHTYECPDCGKCYGVIGHLLNHQRSHRQASKSVFHDLEHLKKKSFQCESCGRNYSRASALDAHRRCHEGKLVKSRNRSSGDSFHTEESIVDPKPSENSIDETPEKLFKCSCGKAYTAPFRLRTHQRFSRNSQCSPEIKEFKEAKEKPKKSCGTYYCSDCNKYFNGHIALLNHQRWHANHSAKRFPCEKCGKVFTTLAFHYRHQRMVHSDEAPAKSFLHQVCQLQKKAFECKDCGLKFSRATALHSHQLHHTDVFRETEKLAQAHTPMPPQQKISEGKSKETGEEIEADYVLSTSTAEEDSHINGTDEDVESYEPGDFNVQVISASESEDEAAQDLNPDLELLCESDQEGRDEGETDISQSCLVSKPEMDLKIVQIDFDFSASEAENKPTAERFDCPDCYRWFSSASSLRVHRMWHGVHKRKQETKGQSVRAYAFGHEPQSCVAQGSHVKEPTDPNAQNDLSNQEEGLEQRSLTCGELSAVFSRHPNTKEFYCPDCMMCYPNAASLFNHMSNCSAQKEENVSITKKEYNPKKTLLGPKIYHCEQCGKGFWSLGAYSHHKQNPSQCADLRLRKGVVGSVNGSSRSRVKVACPVCGRKFRHRGIMTLHMRKHENGNHKCELCNRSFRLFSSLLRHQVVHSDQLPPPIKSFQHQVEQLKKNTYSCPDCGKLFSREKALQFHMKSHGYETGHSPSSPRASSVTLEGPQCTTCLAHFNNKSSLRAHQKLCMKREDQVGNCKTKNFENNEIPKLSKESMDLDSRESSERLTVNTGIKKEMETGDRQIGDQTIQNTADLKYKCKICDRSFSVIGALNLHKRIHAEGYISVAKAKSTVSPKEQDGKGLFHCSVCGKTFISKLSLSCHKRWHSEKIFSRSLLREQFLNHSALPDHQMFNLLTPQTEPDMNKGVEDNSPPDHPVFSCKECKKSFVEGSLLAAHYENEHSNALEAVEFKRDSSQLNSVEQVPGQVDGNLSLSPSPKMISHQCPLCSCSFAKVRGLRAHKWQAHSRAVKGKNKTVVGVQTESVASTYEVKNIEDTSSVDSTTVISSVVTKKNGPVKKGRKKIKSEPVPVNAVLCLECGQFCSSVGALIDHNRVCQGIKQDLKREIHTPEVTAEVSPPNNRPPDQAAKYLFKCDKCGKAFQTEEHLATHKTKAKSRPYCCALCCHGFWTENQLQQHLAWHDEVRYRLPNEVRLRLSAAMTTKPLKTNLSLTHNTGKSLPSSTPNRPTPKNQSQSSLKCHHCGRAFLSPAALQSHETQHCNSDSYQCSRCPRTFSEMQDLIDHHQECFGDYERRTDAPAAVSSGDTNGLTCFECGATFCEETDLHQHYTEHV